MARLNAAGSALLYATYLGGGNDDMADAVAVDATGAATVVGWTDSTNFPTTAGAYDTSYNGGGDAFVARLNAAGNGLLYATYLGGAGLTGPLPSPSMRRGRRRSRDDTDSTNFPTTAGAYDTSFNGVDDAFVARLNAAGNGLLYATYLGGAGY